MLPQLNSNSTISANPDALATLTLRRWICGKAACAPDRSEMRTKPVIAILFIALFLSGCAATERVTDYFKGSSDNAEPPNPLVEFRPLINVIELWKKNNGIGTDEQYLKLAPVIVNQRVYVVDSAGEIGSLDATNGKSLWRKKIEASESVDGKSGWFRGENIRITGGPGYGENTLLVGSMEGEVVSLSAENGSELWRARVIERSIVGAAKGLEYRYRQDYRRQGFRSRR